MEDTLRYFFSAMFQGFAALIALGAMYFLYFFDKLESQKRTIEEVLKQPTDRMNLDPETKIALLKDIVKCWEQKILPGREETTGYDYERKLVNDYGTLISRRTEVKNYLSNLLKKTILILIISLISLFLIGFYDWLDNILAIVGVISILLSIHILLLIKKIISKIMQYD